MSGRDQADRICIQSPGVRDLRGRGVAGEVIDSGVKPEHPHVGAVAGGARINLAGGVSDDWVDRLGHGTAVFAAIQEKAPEADLFAVLVLDEATSALDAEAQATVVAAYEEVMRGRTTVVISHREEVVGSADRVVEGGGWWDGRGQT